ncbi:hypothetical protein BHM03_00019657 [Ensete ventricosum]|nr:hypothetical protein BHM03_00019657 [Ensete ventricosum]
MPPAQASPGQPSPKKGSYWPRSLRLGDDGSPDESPRLRVVYRFVAVVLLDGATPVVRPSQIPRLLSGPFSNFFYNCLLIFTPLLHSKEPLTRKNIAKHCIDATAPGLPMLWLLSHPLCY